MEITKELFIYTIKYLFIQIIYEEKLRKKLEKEKFLLKFTSFHKDWWIQEDIWNPEIFSITSENPQ